MTKNHPTETLLMTKQLRLQNFPNETVLEFVIFGHNFQGKACIFHCSWPSSVLIKLKN